MQSATLALFTRSLREDTRRATPFFARMGLTAVILLFLAWAHSNYSFRYASAPGLSFFAAVIWINAVFFTVVGLAHFSSVITEEKEEMTLGLLRMTNLNPLSILLGKSTNRLFVALLYLAAQFPFTLLAVSLGGVAIGQIIAAYLALAAYVIFLANLALFFSVICRRTYAAAFFTFISLLVFFIAVWITYGISIMLGQFGTALPLPFAQWLLESTIWWRLANIFETGFSDNPFCIQVVSNIGAGLVLFFASWLIFNRTTRNQLGDDGGPKRSVTMGRVGATKNGRRRMLSPDRPGSNALYWKDWHFTHNGKLGMLLRFCLLGLIFFIVIPGFYYMFDSRADDRPFSFEDFLLDREDFGAWMFFVSLILLVLQLSLLAGRIFRSEIQWKTLSSIAMLPMSMGRIAYQKVGAALVATLPSFCFLIFGVILFSEEFFEEIERWDAEELIYFCIGVFYVISQIILGVHLIAMLSLYLKWGAFALGLFIIFVANMAFGMFASLISFGDSDGVFGVMFLTALGALGISIALIVSIGKGLVNAAAKE
jgi:hypothetical protein